MRESITELFTFPSEESISMYLGISHSPKKGGKQVIVETKFTFYLYFFYLFLNS